MKDIRRSSAVDNLHIVTSAKCKKTLHTRRRMFRFLPVMSVRKILFCSGKVYYDLLERQQTKDVKDIAIVRLEQLYPFPEKQFQALFKR